MTLASLGVNESQRWRLARGEIPGCPIGTIVSLGTTGPILGVSRPWFGVIAQLDLRLATITASSDGREIVLGTAGGEVAFEQADRAPVAPAGSVETPDVAGMVGQIVQFGGKALNANGSNLFVFLVLRRVNGWVLGLSQDGHPTGIAEGNIAWAQVKDPGPRQAPDHLVLSFVGKRKACQRALESEVPTLRELGYEVVDQSFYQEPRDRATTAIALLLAAILFLLLIGIAILVTLIVFKPPGILTVTLRRSGPAG